MVVLRSTCFSPLYLFQDTAVVYIAQWTSHRYSLVCVDGFIVMSILLITFRVSSSSLFGHFLVNVVCCLFFKSCSFASRKVVLAWFNRSVYLSGIVLSGASVYSHPPGCFQVQVFRFVWPLFVRFICYAWYVCVRYIGREGIAKFFLNMRTPFRSRLLLLLLYLG